MSVCVRRGRCATFGLGEAIAVVPVVVPRSCSGEIADIVVGVGGGADGGNCVGVGVIRFSVGVGARCTGVCFPFRDVADGRVAIRLSEGGCGRKRGGGGEKAVEVVVGEGKDAVCVGERIVGDSGDVADTVVGVRDVLIAHSRLFNGGRKGE